LPSDDDPVSRRLADLEVKLAFADDLLEHLNRQVAEQQRQIQMLVQEVLRQREQLAEGQPAAFRSLRDELPPHY
jgi:SlyX protein